jgi:fluoride exporter
VSQAWHANRAAAIAVGGVMGATVRWAVLTTVPSRSFPWPLLLLNGAGSILLGLLLASEWSRARARLLLHDLGGIGFCGGLTTFSTFSLEVVALIRDGAVPTALLYVVASVASALLGVALGAAALRRLRAVTIPLEEEP